MENKYEKIKKEKIEDLAEILSKFFELLKGDLRRDKNVIVTCNITKQQAKQGLTKNIKISTADICDTCNGTGRKIEYQAKKCEECYGRGFVYNERNMIIKIPPKIKNNDYIVIEKQGNQFKIDKERGNLFIRIHIYGNRSKRKGKMLYE